jgi:hypothetical protein
MDVVDRLADVLALEGQLRTSLSEQAEEVRGHAAPATASSASTASSSPRTWTP